ACRSDETSGENYPSNVEAEEEKEKWFGRPTPCSPLPAYLEHRQSAINRHSPLRSGNTSRNIKNMKNDLFNLGEETAVVLGGTGVLGGGMAEALAGAGARVAVVGRNENRGWERVRRIEAAGGQAIFQAADAVDRNSLLRARDAILRQWG